MENNDNQLPKKRQRTENWLEDDKNLLKELVKERVHAIENKNTDTNTNKKKLEAWKDLHLNFNLMCKGVQRTIAQLKSQWGIVKMGAKKAKTVEREVLIKTGGGPPSPTVNENADDNVTSLPNEFVVDSNEYDSDSSQISQIVTKGTENNEKNIKDFKRPTSDLHNSSRKMKKLKLASANISTQQSILTIAEVETKCRQELHKIQIENEKKKGRNLDLEYEILQLKLKFYQTDQ